MLEDIIFVCLTNGSPAVTMVRVIILIQGTVMHHNYWQNPVKILVDALHQMCFRKQGPCHASATLKLNIEC